MADAIPRAGVFTLQKLRTGNYYGPVGMVGGAATLAITANNLYAVPFLVQRTTTWDRIALQVTTGGIATTTARLGIYNDGTNLYPGTLVVDAGTVAVDSTGVKAATISQQLQPGLYWLAFVSDGAPVIRRTGTVPWGLLGVDGTELTAQDALWTVAFTYAALPDPFTAGGTESDDHYVVCLRLLSLD